MAYKIKKYAYAKNDRLCSFIGKKYQREGVPKKIPIERFCVMNGYTYKQFEQWP